MNNKRGINVVLVFALFIVIGFTIFTFAIRAKADGNEVEGETAVADVIDTTFTYQGSLESNGTPVNGTCDFKFSLWEDGLLGGQVGSDVTKTDVPVDDGIFTVALDFGDQFKGEGRSLHTQVRCPAGGSGSYTDIGGSVALNAVPYALSLRPGATINGEFTADSVLSVVNTATSGSGAGLYGQAQASGAAGVAGYNTNSSGGYGLYGSSSASSGTPYGVYGIAANSGSATSYGVYGKSNSSSGTGIGGIAPKNGVYGESTATSGAAWGVFGKSASSGGKGVSGTAPLYGVYGEATGVVGNGYGVYGKTEAVDGYGVYSEGNTHVNGKLTWKPITSTISIHFSAFSPFDDGYTFDNGSGEYLSAQVPTTQYWMAPMNLPDGATVTKFTLYWSNNSSSVAGSATLYRTDLNGGEDEMAAISMPVSNATATSTSDNSISYATVDNSAHSYYIWAMLRTESGSVKIYGATVEYTIDTPY